MAKKNLTVDNSKNTAQQLPLFDQITQINERDQKPRNVTGSCNIQLTFKEILSQAMTKSGLSRYEIAGQMSNLLAQEISKFTIDAWVAESKELHRMPAEYLVAFCKVTNSTEPLNFICKELGLFVMPGTDALRSEINVIDEQIKKLNDEKGRRIAFLQLKAKV